MKERKSRALTDHRCQDGEEDGAKLRQRLFYRSTCDYNEVGIHRFCLEDGFSGQTNRGLLATS